jgi:predicted dehydrogenase
VREKRDSPLRIGLIGAGWISEDHLRGWNAVRDRAQAVAVADIDENAAQRLARQYSAKAYTQYLEMLAREALDAVDICVPPHLHQEIVSAAARAGVNVLCEKPVARDLEEADQIDAVVRSCGILYIPAHNTVFLPTVQRAKAYLSQGDLGRIYWMRSLECYTDLPPTRLGARQMAVPEALKGPAWRASKTLLKGGALIDGGFHAVYRLLYLSGSKPVAVSAMLSLYHPGLDWETEDTAILLVQFDDGMIGEVIISYAFNAPTLGEDRLFTIAGREGILAGNEHSLYLQIAGWQQTTVQALSSIQGDAAGTASIAAEIAHFVDCLEGRTEPIQTFSDARLALQVVRAAYQSAEQGATVRIDP